MKTFATAFAQVFLVTVQTWLISRANFPGVLLVGFGISLLWTVNVRRTVFGTWRDRITYAAGAGCGAVAGLALAVKIF